MHCYQTSQEQRDAVDTSLPLLDPRAADDVLRDHAIYASGHARRFVRNAGATTSDALTAELNAIAKTYQATPAPEKITLSGRIGRMGDAAWWVRNLRREMLRENEAIEHAEGTVRRKKQVYVSDHAVKLKRVRAKANARTLDGLEVVNDSGQAFNLGEVAKGSVSNPKLRRAELMTRCRGFEETAQVMGHEAVFLTITCPSRFHRFDGQGKQNAKWQGTTPRDAQDYLNGVWKKIRSEWKRNGFAPYGFRVAEPHHDGCPHWHILLFAPVDHMGWFVPHRFLADRTDVGAGLVGVAGHHALADSPTEAGACKHRFTVERIDTAKGGATGYIAKYICKNIDGLQEGGEGMGLDFASGKPADVAAERVRAWASTWGIRQFQQIGGPSVTVWREIRRLSNQINEPLPLRLFEGAREAADQANWMAFWLLQGGPSVPRSELKLKPYYTEKEGGKYGDLVKRVVGIEGEGESLQTRLHEWTVQRAGLADVNAFESERLEMRAVLRQAFGVNDAFEFERMGEARAPWTGVNNCTGLPEVMEPDGSDLAGFEAFMASQAPGPSPETGPLRH